MTEISIFLTWPNRDHGGHLNYSIQFNQWFPLAGPDFLKIEENDGITKLYFDKGSIGNSSLHENLEGISNYVNIYVIKFYTECTIQISGELKAYIYSEIENKGKPANESIELLYKELCKKVYAKSLKIVNRFFDFCRFKKDNFWLVPISSENTDTSSALLSLNAKFTIDGTKWHRFHSKISEGMIVKIADNSSYITNDDWINAKKFVADGFKIKGYEEILSSAKFLCSHGFLRSAISEAVSALELQFDAVKSMGKGNFPRDILVDPDVDILRHLGHHGFSTSFDIILSREIKANEIDKSIFRECYNAIMIRNNVVHNGQRKLDETEIWKSIKQIDMACKFFDRII